MIMAKPVLQEMHAALGELVVLGPNVGNDLCRRKSQEKKHKDRLFHVIWIIYI